jgi:hypothetical protein
MRRETVTLIAKSGSVRICKPLDVTGIAKVRGCDERGVARPEGIVIRLTEVAWSSPQ